MSDYLTSVLDQLVPRFEDERGDWGRVLADAGVGASATARPQRAGVAASTAPRRGRRRISPGAHLTRRRLVLVAALAVVIAAPLIAAASQSWWFLRFPDSVPQPITGVSVVKSGTWEGKPWQLVAYLSATDGICFGLNPTATGGSAGEGAALSCDQIEGVPRTEKSKHYIPHGITFLSGSSQELPAYVVGPVVDTAEEVAVYLRDGTVIRTPTFDAPDELGAIRFYATQAPEPDRVPGLLSDVRFQKLVGLGDEGEIVACLVFPMPEQGVPLSACS